MTRDLLREFIWEEVLNFRPNMKARRDKFIEMLRAQQAAAAAASSGSHQEGAKKN